MEIVCIILKMREPQMCGYMHMITYTGMHLDVLSDVSATFFCTI